MTSSRNQRRRRSVARSSFHALALVAVALSTTACDQLQQSTDTGGIPTEIASACVTTLHMGAPFNVGQGYTLSQIVETLEAKFKPVTSTWEPSKKGYIWRWSIHDDLKNFDNALAIEFAAQPNTGSTPYPGKDCGPLTVRAEGGLMDGEPLPDVGFSGLLEAAVKMLAKEQSASKPEVAPIEQADVGPNTVPNASDAAITTEWLIGTWGSAENNPTSNPNASCDTDTHVTFSADGTYRDGGSRGRYALTSDGIIYSNRIKFDEVEGTEDRSEFDEPLTASASRVDENTMLEEGMLLRRCSAD